MSAPRTFLLGHNAKDIFVEKNIQHNRGEKPAYFGALPRTAF